MAFVQQATNQKNATGTTLTVTLGATPKFGNLLVATVGTNDQTTSVTGITGAGATWTQRARNATNGTQKLDIEIWEGANPDGITSGSVVITISGTGVETGANVSEFSGVVPKSPEVSIATQAASTTAATTGSVTIATPVLAIATCEYASTTAPSAGPTNSFTALSKIIISTVSTLITAYRYAPATTGSTSCGWTIGAVRWGTALASFDARGLDNNRRFANADDNGNGVMSVTEKRR